MSVEDVCDSDVQFADSIAKACHTQYHALPKTGKPHPLTEWTLLSGVVQLTGGRLEVVALGTGSKCLGATAMSPRGDVLNDSHAEVIARRSFLRYLYHETERYHATGASGVFGGGRGGRCVLRGDVTFHLYTSRMPCGDAAIFPKGDDNTQDFGEQLKGNESVSNPLPKEEKEQTALKSDSETSPDCKSSESSLLSKQDSEDLSKLHASDSKTSLDRKSVDNGTRETSEAKRGNKRESEDTNEDEGQRKRPAKDIHRTGARCVATSRHQDSHSPGVGYHVLGVLRTKPGRGDPTLSLSCSDKLARWYAVGCQGALLSLLVEPVRFSSLIVGGGCPFSRESLARAVVERTRVQRSLLIVQASVSFTDGRPADGSKLPCSSSIAWCLVPDRPLEVSVKGRKQGVTKKVSNTPSGRLLICKRELARRFVSVYASSPLAGPQGTDELKRTSYARLKAMAESYREDWLTTRTLCFPSWPDKPANLLEFTLDGG